MQKTFKKPKYMQDTYIEYISNHSKTYLEYKIINRI